VASSPQRENCTLAIVSHRQPRIHQQSDVSIKKDVELLSRCFRTIHSAVRTSRAFHLDNARLKIMRPAAHMNQTRSADLIVSLIAVSL
jgi:hypothetical protein